MFLREIFLLLSPTDCAHQLSHSPGSCRPHLEWPEELCCSNSCLIALSNASSHLPLNSTFLYTDKKKNYVAYIIYWRFGGSFATGISGIFLHTKQDGQVELWTEVWKCCLSGPSCTCVCTGWAHTCRAQAIFTTQTAHSTRSTCSAHSANPSPLCYFVYLGSYSHRTFRPADILYMSQCIVPTLYSFPLKKMHNQIKSTWWQENQGPPPAKLMESLICLANKPNDFYSKSLWVKPPGLAAEVMEGA